MEQPETILVRDVGFILGTILIYKWRVYGNIFWKVLEYKIVYDVWILDDILT